MRGGKTAGGRSPFFFRYFLLFAALAFSLFQTNVHRIYGFSLYPDEFGYWACAARMLGYDWSKAASLGSYYSYGYGVILSPVLRVFQDSVTAYRAALAVNMLLQCVAAGMLWGIFKRVHRVEASREREMQAVLAVGVAVFYPPWSMYVQTTMAEALLMFLYICICWQIVLFTEKPSANRAVLLALSLLYMYFVHMRTVSVAVAAVVTLALYAWKRPSARKMLAVAALVCAAGAVCGLWVKGKVTDTVYAVADPQLLSANDYAGQAERLKSLFTLQGVKELLSSGAGKFYYLMLASFGLFVPAAGVCLREGWKLCRGFFRKPECGRMEDHTGGEYFYFFCLLSMAGQFGITAVATMHPGRLDGFVYGRYNEHLLPVFIGLGALAVCEMRHKLRLFLISAVVSAALCAVTLKSALHSGLTVMQGYFAAGLSYLSDDWNYGVGEEFWKGCLFGIFLMGYMMVCIHAGKRRGKTICALGAALLIEAALALCLVSKYVVYFNGINDYNLRIARYVSERELPATYLYSGGRPLIGLIQFAVRDREIAVVRLEEVESFLQEEGFLIVDQGCEYLEELEQLYRKCMESPSFVLFVAE